MGAVRDRWPGEADSTASFPKDNVALAVTEKPQSVLAEAYRALRTSILLSLAPNPPKSILIASAQAGEGKTSTALNLAQSLAQRKGDVVIVDGDSAQGRYRQDTWHRQQQGHDHGPYRLRQTDDVLQQFSLQPNLWVLPSGPTPPNPAELIGSDRMAELLKKLSERFEHVIIDSPPVLVVTDGTILAGLVDGVVLVAESGRTHRAGLMRTRAILENAGARILGVVLNKLDMQREGYYGYGYGYYPLLALRKVSLWAFGCGVILTGSPQSVTAIFFMATAEITPPTAQVVAPPLRVTFAWTLAGNVIYAGCQWGMISVLAKLGSTTAVGQFALALAITAPIFMLTNLALRSVEATDARSEFGFGHYFTLRITSTSLALAAILATVTLLGYDKKVSAVIVLIGLAKAVESVSDVIAGLLQKHERLDQVAISMMLKGGLSIVAFGATFYYLRSVAAACVALVLAWLSVFLVYDLRLANNLLGRHARFFDFSIGKLSQLAKLSLPLGIVAALSSFNFNIPRYAIQHYRGASELGIFSAWVMSR